MGAGFAQVTVGVAFSSVVDCVRVVAAYTLVAGHDAVIVQVPVSLVIVTVAVSFVLLPLVPLTVHDPLVVRVALTPAFVLAVTGNVPRYGAVAGAPVKLTVG
jgi:hypothetical protein